MITTAANIGVPIRNFLMILSFVFLGGIRKGFNFALGQERLMSRYMKGCHFDSADKMVNDRCEMNLFSLFKGKAKIAFHNL